MTNDNDPIEPGDAPEAPRAPPRPKARIVWLLWLLPLAGLVLIAWYVLRGGMDRTHSFNEVTGAFAEQKAD